MNPQQMFLAAEHEGRRDAETHRHRPSAARGLELGRFNAGSRPGMLLLRRLLLALRVPPRLIAAIRTMLGGGKVPPEQGFLWKYSYWRGVRRTVDRSTWSRLIRPPVILMYHAVAGPAERPSCYVVSRWRFLFQMLWLRLSLYRVIALSRLVDDIRCDRLPPARSVVITFDDGYADNYQAALPILRRLRLPATVFLVSRALGGHANWTSEPALAGRPLLSPALVEEMRADGIDVGAHTRTHVSLTAMPPGPDREAEVAGSLRDLEAVFGIPVRVFAYPFGDYDARIAGEVRQAGFHAACCSRDGLNDPATPPFELRRVEVRGTDSLFRYAVMVWAGRRLKWRSAFRASPGARSVEKTLTPPETTARAPR